MYSLCLEESTVTRVLQSKKCSRHYLIIRVSQGKIRREQKHDGIEELAASRYTGIGRTSLDSCPGSRISTAVEKCQAN